MSRYAADLDGRRRAADELVRRGLLSPEAAQAADFYYVPAIQPVPASQMTPIVIQVSDPPGRWRGLDELPGGPAEAGRGPYRGPALRPAPERHQDRQPRPVVEDAEGSGHLRPDPRCSRTGAELADALADFHVWAGAPSLRRMAEACGQAVSRSSLHRVLTCTGLPGFDAMLAVVAGCGGTEEDRSRFASAWRAIRTGQPAIRTAEPLRAVPESQAG